MEEELCWSDSGGQVCRGWCVCEGVGGEGLSTGPAAAAQTGPGPEQDSETH